MPAVTPVGYFCRQFMSTFTLSPPTVPQALLAERPLLQHACQFLDFPLSGLLLYQALSTKPLLKLEASAVNTLTDTPFTQTDLPTSALNAQPVRSAFTAALQHASSLPDLSILGAHDGGVQSSQSLAGTAQDFVPETQFPPSSPENMP